MITRAEAEEVAAGWARSESERRGYACTPMLSEFDLGYVVWTRGPETVTPIPGDGGRTVIDRATGLLTTWPSVPVETVAELYRERQPALAARPRTLDPAVELLRDVRRRPTPTTAAHLTVEAQFFRARGAKGDQEIAHHPLVAEHLATVDPGARVRGDERHAELIVLSDALHFFGPAGKDEARELLRTADFEAFHVREPGDPLAGQPARSCETCIRALVDFAVLPWLELARAAPWEAGDPGDPAVHPGRFSEPVERVLRESGWHEIGEVGRVALADNAIAVLEGYGHRAFPAARQVLIDFTCVMTLLRGPGVRRAIRRFHLVPEKVPVTAASLADLSRVLGGAGLFPIGSENSGETLLAIDEAGRVFGLDQGGEWYLGASIDEALEGLVRGDGPAERLHDDGTW